MARKDNDNAALIEAQLKLREFLKKNKHLQPVQDKLEKELNQFNTSEERMNHLLKRLKEAVKNLAESFKSLENKDK